ncbi:hypothetical protein NUW58_g2756 [Xylaria curta]|uniref:Uncharacterized protein n=1 Tax=Xylaria curta TaxID=42375 RepID=A0ACC1PE35_9PEZI|nr:hypothetical protein NUW58_g2756 [Xylaria curta]
MDSITESKCSSKWVEIFDPDKYYPILETLSSSLTIADFLVLCQVCKKFKRLKECMLRKISNINVWLSDFVDDPTIFRSQLGVFGALLSGPFALNVFELGRQKTLTLDIFVREGANADQLTNYIRETEKYQHVETTGTRRTYCSSGRPGVKLRITRAASPVQAILTLSRTTAHINFITWNKAYSLFPRQTLLDHQFYPLGSLDNGFGSGLSELAHHGWTTRDIVWPDLADKTACKVKGRLRRVGDNSSLVISLDTSSVQRPSAPDSVIEYAQFRVEGRGSPNEDDHDGLQGFQNPRPIGGFRVVPSQSRDPNLRKFLTIQAQKVTSAAVRSIFTTASSEWRTYLTDRLNRWAWLEFYKLESDNRPALPPRALPLVSDVPDFELPQSWDYADDQIPRWYQEWEEKNSVKVKRGERFSM